MFHVFMERRGPDSFMTISHQSQSNSKKSNSKNSKGPITTLNHNHPIGRNRFFPALVDAIWHIKPERVRCLLEHAGPTGLDPNFGADTGYTPLQLAISSKERLEMAKDLLEYYGKPL